MRLKELCSNLNSNEFTMLKVCFEYSRAYQMYLKPNKPISNEDNILNKIIYFNNFIKNNTH